MDASVGSVLAPYVALAAMLLGISLVVQVLQEVWKFATSSKAVAFENALDDFAGTWAATQLRQNTTIAVRGPLQFRRVSTAGHVLPLARADLLSALEQASPAWHRLIDQALQFESVLQEGVPAVPSPALTRLLVTLQAEVQGARPTSQALEMHTFLATWGIREGASLDAVKARAALRQEFFAHLLPIDLHYDRLMQNFQYAYERRNLRQTFTWALALALIFNLPIAGIYRRAAALPLADALALSEKAQGLHADYLKLEAERAQGGNVDEVNLQALREREERLNAVANDALQIASGRTINSDVRVLFRELQLHLRSLSFLIGCLLTAILVSFGAPFWNDISTALYRIAKPAGARQQDPGARA
jgi:hypothetical protein